MRSEPKNVFSLIYRCFAEALSWPVNKVFLIQIFLLSQKKINANTINIIKNYCL